MIIKSPKIFRLSVHIYYITHLSSHNNKLPVIKRFHDNISFQQEIFIIILEKELFTYRYRRNCATSRIFSQENSCVTLNNNVT